MITPLSEDSLPRSGLVHQWLADCCEEGKQLETSSTLLFSSWKDWAEAAGERHGTHKALSELLRTRGFRKHRNARGIVFLGLQLKAR
jgi:putative DNA primase/helicase